MERLSYSQVTIWANPSPLTQLPSVNWISSHLHYVPLLSAMKSTK